jgi:1,4-alpha-glucan branching enzyme
MYPLKSYQKPDRYAAKNNTKPINFVCHAPNARKVSIVGDFNQWNASANPLRKMPDGSWQGQVPLSHGHHRYVFLVDDLPMLDPRATGVARKENNERVSLIAIS